MSEKKNIDEISFNEVLEDSVRTFDADGNVVLRQEDLHRLEAVKNIKRTRWFEMTDEEREKFRQKKEFNTSIFNDGIISTGKRGRKPTVMRRSEWEMFYLNKPIQELVTELVDLKMGERIVLSKLEYDNLKDKEKECVSLQQRINKLREFFNSDLFSNLPEKDTME